VPLTGRLVLGLAAVTAALGCATKGSVRLVETQVAVLRAQTARADSARAAELTRIIALQQRILDSLAAGREALRQVRNEVGGDLLSVQEQLVQIQELVGVSTRRLGELRRDLDNRAEQLAMRDTAPPSPGPGDTAAAAPAAVPTPDQLYQGARTDMLRGSLNTARTALREFLRLYPTHPQVPEATYSLAETFETEQPDSAVHYYNRVAEQHRASPRAPEAVYKVGLLAEKRQDRAGARQAYERLIAQYPTAAVAELARARLASLRP
jgi:TolA-binding protein